MCQWAGGLDRQNKQLLIRQRQRCVTVHNFLPSHVFQQRLFLFFKHAQAWTTYPQCSSQFSTLNSERQIGAVLPEDVCSLDSLQMPG